MACISRQPRCSDELGLVSSPLSQLVAWIGILVGVIAFLKFIGAISISNGVLSIGGFVIGGGAAAGLFVGFVTAVALFALVSFYKHDVCGQTAGSPVCVAGVVSVTVPSFSSDWDGLFPFLAMHDRVDVLAKSGFWDLIERDEAAVFCTSEDIPRKSELMRCYFFDAQVCAAATGAMVGAFAGAVGGIIAAALITAGCVALLLLCLIIAILAAAALVLGGAWIGGQIGKHSTGDATPNAETGETLPVGTLVTVRGNMVRRERDNGANVLYYVSAAQFHGASRSPQPFSYCEIDDELVDDGCGSGPIIL